MQALVTRPIENAGGMTTALAARGVVALVDPLLAIRFIPDASLDLAGVAALLFTSSNGARAFAATNPRRDLKVFTVGDATAAVARDLGFAAVVSAAGDVEDLASLVTATLSPGDGALLHPAGSVVAGDLAGRLGAAGFDLRRTVLYAAEPAPTLAAATIAALRARTLDAAFFFSPRTASRFVTLATDAAVGGATRRVAAFCLSQAVAAALEPLPWAQVVVAATPDQAALLAAFDRFHAALP
ncbi:MAG: hemD [Rhodospirillales bacterium]|nr:hemD [Rhodospirillales bacterium]